MTRKEVESDVRTCQVLVAKFTEAAMRDYDLKYDYAQEVFSLNREEDGRWRVWCVDEPVTRRLHYYLAQRKLWELRVKHALAWMKKERLDRIIRCELKKSPRPDWRRVCDDWARYRGDPDYTDAYSGSASGERSAAGDNNVIVFPRLPRE